jgi:hypothetical protein
MSSASQPGDLVVDVIAQLAALRADLRALPPHVPAPAVAIARLNRLVELAEGTHTDVPRVSLSADATVLSACIVAGETLAAAASEGDVGERVAAIREDLRWAVRTGADEGCSDVVLGRLAALAAEGVQRWPHRAPFHCPKETLETVADALIVAGQLSAAAPDDDAW